MVVEYTESVIFSAASFGASVGARYALDFSKWLAAGVGAAAAIGAGTTQAFGFYVSPFGLAALVLVSASLGYAGAVQLCGILLLPMHEGARVGSELWRDLVNQSGAGGSAPFLDVPRLIRFGQNQSMTRFQKRLIAHMARNDRDSVAGEMLRQLMLVRRLLIGQVVSLICAFAAVLAGLYFGADLAK